MSSITMLKRTFLVSQVIGGGTIDAPFSNGEVDTIRLSRLDTPGSVSSNEFEGITDTSTNRYYLFNWGERVTMFGTDEFAGRAVRFDVDPAAGRRGSFDRLLVYVFVDGAISTFD